MMKMITNNDADDLETPIQQFYRDQCIFISGGTGFLGKSLIEKLLRSCNSLRMIYLLIRAKKGKTVDQRLEELFDDPVFEKVKAIYPKFRYKTVGIVGDCSLPGLGLGTSDRRLLCNEVSVVFHVAATLKFDEKLRLACQINVKGPQDMFELCTQMRQLKSIVHVSTAYSNCPHMFIEEKFYPTPIESNKLLSFIDSTEEKILDQLTGQILNNWPNTYTFTKAIAENLIRENYIHLPVGIFRPAIVISTYKEPIKGWVDNMYGPTGICMGVGTGVIHTLPCNPNANANVVPVDFCVNALLCSAWYIYKTHQDIHNNKQMKTEQNIPIFNYVSSVDQPITWDHFLKSALKSGLQYPSSRAIWYYSFRLNKHWLIHLIYVFFQQFIPALIFDAALLCLGKPPQVYKLYKKIMRFTNIIQYFTLRNWQFSNTSTKQLLSNLSQKDQELFEFDLKDLKWDDFFENYVKGIRSYLLKEPLKSLPDAQKRWKKLYWLHQITKTIIFIIILRIIWMLFQFVIYAT